MQFDIFHYLTDFPVFWTKLFVIGTAIVLAFCLTVTVVGAATPLNTPDSGMVLEGSKPPEKPAESTEEAPLQIADPAPAPAFDSRQIRVNGFCFSGELPVAEADLQHVTSPQVGKDFTINDLNLLAAQLTHYLRGRGYLVATAYIPTQTIRNGLVEITIVPGKYGAIAINNQAQILTGRLEKMAAELKTGDVVTKAVLERVLLLINDLPGIDVKASLAPGQSAGTTDLTLNIIDIATSATSLYTDNWGSRYTGAYRGGFSFSFANPNHYGDFFQIGIQTAGSDLDVFSLDYSLPLKHHGTRLALNYSRVNYRLGEDFADLDAGGTATVTGLILSYPIKRSRNANLYCTFGYDYKDLYDVINATNSVTPRTDGICKLGLNGDCNDPWHGLDSFALIYSRGWLTISDPAAAAADSATRRTAGCFNKLSVNYRRQQQLSPRFGLDFKLNGQICDSNLDSSEKLYLGGAGGVRAYPQGEAACDQGCLFTMELKCLIGKGANSKDNFYLINFYDYAFGQANKNLWNGADTDNRRHLADIGLGLVWTRPDFNLRLDYAWKLNGQDAGAGTYSAGRLWLQCVKYL